MKVALVNPNWVFDGSIYFGCREAHLPLEFGYSKALLEAAGHQVSLIDGQLDQLSLEEITRQVAAFGPDYTVVTSAPSYLFWRCAPPELTCPQDVINAVRPIAGKVVLVGPHASTTPRAALDKTGADFVVLGECEEVLVQLLEEPLENAKSIGYYVGDDFVCGGVKHSADMQALPALQWTSDQLKKHRHHHHRFDIEADGWGAEMETSRGCPYACSFCAKDNFRNKYRKRPLPVILEEIDGLIAAGARYVYFVDEIFLPNRELLEALCERDIQFGVQTRIDLWDNDMLDLLGRAGCVSIEAGVESITEEGRAELNKNCKVSTEDMTQRLIHARKSVAFVQGNLIEAGTDEEAEVDAWREGLLAAGVWANKPVPLFPYPGSPDYTRRWGMPDDRAWERAHEAYLKAYDEFSDVQDSRPLELHLLERPAPGRETVVVTSGSGGGGENGSGGDSATRILMTCDAVGGVWTYAMDLCEQYKNANIQVLLAVLGPAMAEHQRKEVARMPHVRVVEHTGALEWMENPWDDVDDAGRWLLRQAENFQPHLVHINGFAHAALPWGVPVMVVAHSCICSWWDNVIGGPPDAQFARYCQAVKKGLAAADVIIAPTRAMLDEIRRHYDVGGNLRVIHNGRTVKTVAPGPRGNYIFSAGRVWDKAKDFETLNGAAAGLGVDVVVAGEYRLDDSASLSNLRLLGKLPPQEVQQYLIGASIFVSTARYEPFGLSILEAALHGCPLVLPDLDSLREIWQNNACYASAHNPASFRQAIQTLRSDEVLRQSMASRAQATARQYTAERMASRYYCVYSELTGRQVGGVSRPERISIARKAGDMRRHGLYKPPAAGAPTYLNQRP